MAIELEELYYVQDDRQYVGNSVLWWAKDHKGYCCDIRKAHVFTGQELLDMKIGDRKSDKPWCKAYVDARISHHIDAQHLDSRHPGAIPCPKTE